MRVLLVAAFLVACGNKEPAKQEPTPTPTPVATATDAPVPAPASDAKPAMPEVANGGPGFLWVKGADYEGVIADGAGPWTPSPQDVAVVEVALGPALAAHELGKAHAARDFKRQYGGVEIAGARVIRVQLSCDTPKTWPSEGLPSVKGGGTCYGMADFDMASGKLTRLDANSSK